MSDLAYSYGSSRDLEKAAQMHAAAIELMGRHQGRETVAIASSYMNYAMALVGARQQERAQEAARESYRLYARLLGPKHPYTGVTARHLGEILQLGGRNAEALAVLQEAAAIQRRIAGNADHGELALTEIRIAVLLIRSGRYQEGLASLESIVEKLGRIHPQGTLALAEANVKLGFALLEGNRPAAAESHFRKAVEWLGPQMPGTARLAEAECGLGVAVARQGRQGEGRQLLAKAFSRFSGWAWADQVEVERAKPWGRL
jgi:tetratricopeptide (TPR) repeat protein